jgi:hypothetical protein
MIFTLLKRRVEQVYIAHWTMPNTLLTYLLTYLSNLLNVHHGAGYFWKAVSHSTCRKITCFLYVTRRFITVFTKARHWTLSWASRTQFAPSIPISLRSILALSSHLRLGLPSGLFPSVLPNQNLVNTSPLPSWVPHVPLTSSSLIWSP